jgi:hypothetical protein
MRASKLRRSTLSILYIAAVIICLSLPAFAQTPSPSPTPTPANPTGSSLSDVYKGIIDRAGDLIPLLQNEIEGPLMPWLEKMSWTLAGLVIMFGFARLWRENAGAGVDVFWWFGRVGIIFALMGTGPTIVKTLDAIGQELAWGGSSGNGDSVVLNRFYTSQRNSFEEGYRRFTMGHFTVEPTGENIKPFPGGEEAVLGVLLDLVSSPEGINKKFESLSHDMPFLFSLLSFARGILAFGDLWLLSLGGFLMIAVRLAAPVMIALAIDRNLAQKISYPFTWGVIVLTLVWPVVSQLIRALAYMGGNLAMSLDRSDGVYQWDPQTMQEIMSSGAEPYHTVIVAVIIIAVAGLSLWASPLIAYRVASGQIYESVSSTVSGWMGALVGAGIESYSAAGTAQLTRQAEQIQALGGFGAEMARAEAGKEAGKLGIQAERGAALAQVFGQRDQAINLANAGRDFQNNAAYQQYMQSYRSLMAARTKENNDNRIAGHQQLDMQTWGAYGEAFTTAGRNMSPFGMGGGKIGDGAFIGLLLQHGGNLIRYRGQGQAVIDGAGKRTKNIQEYYDDVNKSLGTYTENMYGVHGNFANAQIDAATAYANTAAGGINRAATLKGQANQVTYDGAVFAAREVRDASMTAAQLRAVAAVMSAVGHNVARNAEQGMTLRY